MSRFFADPEDFEDFGLVDPPHLEVEITDNPIVAELLGPDGETLLRLTERPIVRFGFH